MTVANARGPTVPAAPIVQLTLIQDQSERKRGGQKNDHQSFAANRFRLVVVA